MLEKEQAAELSLQEGNTSNYVKLDIPKLVVINYRISAVI
jgi:hypothetical protein